MFAALAADIGLGYLSQSLFGMFQASILARARVAIAVFVPAFAIYLFEAIVPSETTIKPRLGRWAALLTIPMVMVVVSPYLKYLTARVLVFGLVGGLIAAGLYELWQRGRLSQSRAIQRRVRVIAVIGALAALFTAIDFGWVLGAAFHPPPVGVLLSVVFLFMLSQALQSERLLDLYELLGRLLVATNPLLEAFGNAETVLNRNSSRFGKFVQVIVSSKGAILGASIQTYLLESTRVVAHSANECAYHINYQIVRRHLPAGPLSLIARN